MDIWGMALVIYGKPWGAGFYLGTLGYDTLGVYEGPLVRQQS